MIAQVSPVINHAVRGLCARAYPGHPKGCPNFSKKQGCPPSAPFIENVLDLSRPVFAIWNDFPLREHVARMAAAHPSWGPRQLACCLYWQPKARKQLRAEIAAFLQANPGHLVIPCPEAMGVNITATMKEIGLDLEWPPIQIARQIALAGIPNTRRNP